MWRSVTGWLNRLLRRLGCVHELRGKALIQRGRGGGARRLCACLHGLHVRVGPRRRPPLLRGGRSPAGERGRRHRGRATATVNHSRTKHRQPAAGAPAVSQGSRTDQDPGIHSAAGSWTPGPQRRVQSATSKMSLAAETQRVQHPPRGRDVWMYLTRLTQRSQGDSREAAIQISS